MARDRYLVDKPGAAQSQIRIGWVGAPRTTADYYALSVLNTALGGSFTSRLNQNLREEHGYAYGASSFFDMRLSAGPFVASAGVQSDKTTESLQEFFKELNGIRQPMTADELTRAKNYLALGFPADFETTGGMAANVATLVIYGLPETFFSDYVRRSGRHGRRCAAVARNMCSPIVSPSWSSVTSRRSNPAFAPNSDRCGSCRSTKS
jgi:predicted Zn-dependent peptidase